MVDFRDDKKWSDQFLPHIKRILGEVLICEPPIEEDQERNTDLITLKMSSVRVGCRVRKAQYFERYSDQFTIRAGRPSGAKTELTKIIEGWGDFFMYGFASQENASLQAWGIGDLKVFRIWFMRAIVKRKGLPPGLIKNNNDNSSNFLAFKWHELPGEFLVSQHNLPLKEVL